MNLLVLGAGSSCEYNYPSGQAMLEDIKKVFAEKNTNFITLSGDHPRKKQGVHRIKVLDYIRPLLEKNNILEQDIINFGKLIQHTKAPSIDIFLAREKNNAFDQIGKLLICFSLMSFETSNISGWYEKFLTSLTRETENFQSHNYKIITFNYDRSLECILFEHIYEYYKLKFLDDSLAYGNAIDEFSKLQIHHMYGCIDNFLIQKHKRYDIFQKNYLSYGRLQHILTNDFEKSSQILNNGMASVKTIFESTHNFENENTINSIVSNSDSVHFIGFGFHDLNSNNIIAAINQQITKRIAIDIFVCNKDYSISKINQIRNKFAQEITISNPIPTAQEYYKQYLA